MHDVAVQYEPDYVVIRPGPGLPDGFLPPHYDGRWIDMTHVPKGPPAGTGTAMGLGEAVAVPTGQFEVRDDGAIAEIYEVRV